MSRMPSGSATASRPVALVTGGARRVGRAIALSLARAGCDVIITYNTSDDEASSAVGELRALGVRARAVLLDLGDLEAVERVGGELEAAESRLDVVVHNAAIYAPTPLESVTGAEAERFYRINALAPLILTKRLAPKLAGSALSGGGAVVAMADIHAMGLPRRGFAAYSMSKAALVEMVRTLARELAPNVRVNAVAPGVVAWPEHGHESAEAGQREYLSRVPLGRAGRPEDAAETVRWLALEAGYVTGQVIRVDGGRSLR